MLCLDANNFETPSDANIVEEISVSSNQMAMKSDHEEIQVVVPSVLAVKDEFPNLYNDATDVNISMQENPASSLSVGFPFK